jgi:uncharacterized damage-inducible protein DinB
MIMKRLAQIFTILALTFVSATAFAQFTQKEMIAEWQRAKAYTKKYLDAMPPDGYTYKPTPEIRTFAEQMLHLADGNYIFIYMATGKPNPMGVGRDKYDVDEKTIAQTKDATTKAVMDSYDFVIATLQSMTPEQLKEPVDLQRGYPLTRGGVIAKGFEHQTHHRGQTTIYLRMKGVTPPPGMIF